MRRRGQGEVGGAAAAAAACLEIVAGRGTQSEDSELAGRSRQLSHHLHGRLGSKMTRALVCITYSTLYIQCQSSELQPSEHYQSTNNAPMLGPTGFE